MHAKLTLVLILFAFHGVCGRYLRQFQQGQQSRSHVFFRWFNEIPVIVLLLVLILVVIKPF
jgi:putative membrane protein